MPLNSSEKSKQIDPKAAKLNRITVSLSDFNAKIIEKLVGIEGDSKSDVVRKIQINWINKKKYKIEEEYGIKFQDVHLELKTIYTQIGPGWIE